MRADYGRRKADQGQWPLAVERMAAALMLIKAGGATGPGRRDPERLDKHSKRAREQGTMRYPLERLRNSSVKLAAFMQLMRHYKYDPEPQLRKIGMNRHRQ